MDDVSPQLCLLLVALIVCSAYFSSTETAFASVNRIRMKNKAAEGDKKSAKVLRIAEDYDRALSAILIGNNVVNIAAASIGTILFTSWLGPSGAGVSTLVLTILILIFGEIIPKTYAKQNADSWSYRSVGILEVLMKILTPFISGFAWLTGKITRKFSDGEQKPSVTEQELKYIIEESKNEGVLERQESELVQSALDFDEKTVAEILTPRVDVVAVDETDKAEMVRDLFFEEGYSRLPVYSGNIDRITGIINHKDFMKAYMEEGEVHLPGIMQTRILRVPPKKPISELMKELQKLKSHMAIVTDQYGGTIGIITLEDIIEELVGEIWDESDEEEIDYLKLSEGRYQVSGDLDPEVFFRKIGFSCTSNEIEALSNSFAGLALDTLERIPEPGDRFLYKNLEITVTEVYEQRITMLEVTVLEEKQSEPET